MQNNTIEKDDVVLYKDKKFIVTYIGNTKFGYKAKLRALNDQFNFWVPAEKIKLYLKANTPRIIRFNQYTPELPED